MIAGFLTLTLAQALELATLLGFVSADDASLGIALSRLAGIALLGAGLVRRIARLHDALQEMDSVRDQRDALLAMLPAIVISTKPSEDSIRFLNDKAKELLGYSQKELNGNPALWFDICHPDDRARHRAERDIALAGERPVLEHRFRHRDGRYRWIRRHLMTIRDGAGNPRELLTCGFDVTDIKDAEARLMTFLSGAPDGMVVVDSRHRIIFTNPRIAELLGYAGDALLGQPIDVLVPERAELAAQQSASQTGRGVETQALHKNGSGIPVEISVGPIGNDTAHSVVWSIRDIRDRKEMEHRLLQSQKMESVGQLTGGLAHDFNNLLTIIIGNLQLLENKLPARERELALTATKAALRGAELTQRLLAFARKQMLMPKVLNPNALVTEVEALLKRTLGADTEISVRTQTDLGQTRADPAQLQSALVNLAVNARDAMPNGGQLTIETYNVVLDSDYVSRKAEVPAGDYVVISVTDTGSGMPPDVLDRVFEPFFSTKETGKGSGLGLSMVYGFVKQSSGHVSIYSEVGHGTAVKIYLPRVVDDVHDVSATAVRPGLPMGAETILVVEDDPDVRRTVVALLSSLGYRVEEAASGADGLAALERCADVDLVFTDVMMPGGMSGIELGAAARRRYPHLKIIYTSGYTDRDLVAAEREGGAATLLTKPYRHEELARKIREVLDREHAWTQASQTA